MKSGFGEVHPLLGRFRGLKTAGKIIRCIIFVEECPKNTMELSKIKLK